MMEKHKVKLEPDEWRLFYMLCAQFWSKTVNLPDWYLLSPDGEMFLHAGIMDNLFTPALVGKVNVSNEPFSLSLKPFQALSMKQMISVGSGRIDSDFRERFFDDLIKLERNIVGQLLPFLQKIQNNPHLKLYKNFTPPKA